MDYTIDIKPNNDFYSIFEESGIVRLYIEDLICKEVYLIGESKF